MAEYPSLAIRGKSYTFDHLDSFCFNVTLSNNSVVKIRVNFSCHCFTEAYDPRIHTPDFQYRWRGEIRAFCPIRYNQSLGLQRMIQALDQGTIKVHFTRVDNYIHLNVYQDSGISLNYCAFFDLKKASKPFTELVMTVQSAYIKDRIPKALDKIRFCTLVEKTLRGEKIVSPRKFQR